MHKFKTQSSLMGVVGFFDDPEHLLLAVKKLKEMGCLLFDAFTPYPVHGLDVAQGLKRSPLPLVAFAAGLTGCVLGFCFEYWTSKVDWPLSVGGKPLNSWPAFVPVMFECTILFAGLATATGMFLLNRLPCYSVPPLDPRITQDRFAVWIESAALPPLGGEATVLQLLQELGAQEVRVMKGEAP